MAISLLFWLPVAQTNIELLKFTVHGSRANKRVKVEEMGWLLQEEQLLFLQLSKSLDERL